MIAIEHITPILLIIYTIIMMAVLKQTCDKSNNELYDTLFASYSSIFALTILCILSLVIKALRRLSLFILGIILGTLLWLLPISYNTYNTGNKTSCLYNISIVNFAFTPIFILLVIFCMYRFKDTIKEQIELELSNSSDSINSKPIATAVSTPESNVVQVPTTGPDVEEGPVVAPINTNKTA